MILTESFVLKKSGARELSEIRVLNLWGLGLKDISVLKKLVNLEVLDLSVNQVTSIRPLYHCRELRELYLRKNAIKLSDLKEIHQLSTLRILWLTENPCVKESRYYEFLLRRLPLLQKLDNKAIESDNNNKQKEKQVGLSRDNTTFHYNKHKVAPIVSRSVGVQTEEASFRVDQHPSKPSIKKSGQLSIILSILLLLRELGIEEIHLIHEILEKYITSG